MVRYSLKLFGLLPLLVVERTIYVAVDEEYEDESPAVGGGSAHNFERDFDPLSPTSHHEWEWEDRGKGFGFSAY